MLSARIALRYLFAKKRHTAVNVISVISLCGVAVATAAIVVVLSVFNGFADLGASQASVVDPDVLLTPADGKTLSQGDSLATVVAMMPGVRAAVPVVQERGLLICGSAQVPVRFKGVGRGYDTVIPLDSLVIEGAYQADSVGGYAPANLSVGVAYHGSVTPLSPEMVRLYVPRRKGRINSANPAASFRGDTLVVRSVLRSDVQEFDADLMIVPLAAARRLLDYTVEATAIEVVLDPGADIDRVMDGIRAAVPGVIVADRLQQQSEAFRMIAIEKWMTFLMLMFILVIASFNVVSTLSLMVVEKRADMEVLRFIGAKRRLTRAIFVWQGWMVSMLGGVIGIVAGAGLSLWQQYGHIIKLNADASALTIDYYPVRLAWSDLLLVLAAVAAVSLLAGQTTRFFQKNRNQ